VSHALEVEARHANRSPTLVRALLAPPECVVLPLFASVVYSRYLRDPEGLFRMVPLLDQTAVSAAEHSSIFNDRVHAM
jgi:hypothetical protein